MTMAREKIEELKLRLQSLKSEADAAIKNDGEVEAEWSAIRDVAHDALLALAERALEPQGQALPELPKADAFRDRIEHYDLYMKDNGTGDLEPLITLDKAIAYARAYASQLALPAGPVPEGMKQVSRVDPDSLAEVKCQRCELKVISSCGKDCPVPNAYEVKK